MSKKQIRQMAKERDASEKALLESSPEMRKDLSDELSSRKNQRIRGEKVDPHVRHLEDPYLSGFSIDDFPRLKKFLDIHFTVKPEVCPELPSLVTNGTNETALRRTRMESPGCPCSGTPMPTNT